MSSLALPDALRVGVLGCSDIARRKFIPALLKSRKATFAACASSHPDMARLMVPEMPGAPVAYEDLVRNPDLDLIYVSLPNHLHEQWSIRALEQGKHVVCEKPLGIDPGSVHRMLEAAEKNGRLLYENIMYLQHPQHRVVKELIMSGRLGRTLSLRSEFAFPRPGHGNIRLDPAMGGGAYHDLNRYPLSAALFFLEGVSYHSIRGVSSGRNGVITSLEAFCLTDAGQTFSFLTAFGRPYRSYYTITGEHGYVRVDRAYTTPDDMENRITVMIDSRDESFTAPASDHFLGTIDHVCDLIRSMQWSAEHERSRTLAVMAAMFHGHCTQVKQ